ncbi:MAG TPA: FAD-dependent oxidoreductase [Byssovorax sp.]|jgi:phytoene dehydrogenase-like protein
MRSEVIVIGGGLGGLATAAFLARGGRRVRVLEKATHVGGRAQSRVERGFVMNIGPHALYKAGPAEAALAELGVAFSGGEPPTSGGYALFEGRARTLPMGPLSLLTTGLLPLGGKLELGRLLARMTRIDASALLDTTLAAWLDDPATGLADATARATIEAFARLTTYTNAPDELSAGVMLAQFQHVAKHNVLYLDGGWQRLVDGLVAVARAAGVVVETGVRVSEIEVEAGAARRVRLADGRAVEADAVIVASSPAAARALLPNDASVATIAERARPVEASCLGVALSSLPNPRATFLLGVDEPVYVSVHSGLAHLAPDGQALVEIARYLAPGEAPAEEEDLLRALEALQPGARERVVDTRFLPRMTVSHDTARAAPGGLAARPRVDAADTRGVWLVGDWVGDAGLLADASFASARAAAEGVLAGANEASSARGAAA